MSDGGNGRKANAEADTGVVPDGPEISGADPDLTTPAPRNWPDDVERALRIWISLARCYSTFASAMSHKVAEDDLTLSQFGLLEALHHVGPMSLGDLAQKMLVTGGNITYVMDRLEERGLVRRIRSDEDRRVVHAVLTREGRDLMTECFPEHAAYIRRLVDTLDPEEEEVLRRLLKKLGTGVAATTEGGGPGEKT